MLFRSKIFFSFLLLGCFLPLSFSISFSLGGSLPVPPVLSPPTHAQAGDAQTATIKVGRLRLALWYKEAFQEDERYIGELYPVAIGYEKEIGRMRAKNLALTTSVKMWEGITIGVAAVTIINIVVRLVGRK